jgi:hypothetical protein
MYIEDRQTSRGDFLDRPDSPMSNLAFGGTNGFLPEIMDNAEGPRFDNWLSNAPYTSSSIIPIPLTPPAGFDLFDDSTARRLRETWAKLLSVHAYTIEGLGATITLETDGRRFHNQSQEIKTVVGSKMEVGMPTYTFIEKPGKPINRFLTFMLNYLSLDYRTQSKTIATDPEIRKLLKGRLDLPNLDSGSIMFIELDAFNANVMEVYYFTNFRLLSAGKVEGKRDLGSNKEILEYSIQTEGLFETNPMYKALAQNIVDSMSIFNKNPDDIKPGIATKDLKRALEDAKVPYNKDVINGIDSDNVNPASAFK